MGYDQNDKCCYLTNTPVDSLEFHEGFIRFLRVAQVVNAVTNLRILQIDTRPEPFASVICNENELLERFNVHVYPVAITDVVAEMKRVIAENDAEYRATMDKISSYDKVGNIEDIQKSSALKVAMKRFADFYGCGAIAIQCWSALQTDTGIMPCLSNALLTDEGIPVVCETDLRLPKISNFTDFGALSCVEAFSVRYVSRAQEFGMPDLVILPGTKNTIADLKWLKESGLAAKIQRYAGAGNPLIGICGGYQMLCRKISDPYGVEEGGEIEGLGLVKAETVFGQQKMRTRVNGQFGKVSGVLSELSGAHFEGYEIHMGNTIGQTDLTHLSDADGNEKQDGISDHVSVYGSYVHGLFDSNEVLQALSKALLKRKGIGTEQKEMMSLKDYKEQQYNLLADSLRRSLDMELVYKILNEGVKEA